MPLPHCSHTQPLARGQKSVRPKDALQGEESPSLLIMAHRAEASVTPAKGPSSRKWKSGSTPDTPARAIHRPWIASQAGMTGVGIEMGKFKLSGSAWAVGHRRQIQRTAKGAPLRSA